eukprot:111589-Rhodomonas_salina.2
MYVFLEEKPINIEEAVMTFLEAMLTYGRWQERSRRSSALSLCRRRRKSTGHRVTGDWKCDLGQKERTRAGATIKTESNAVHHILRTFCTANADAWV